jgi:MFS family permease
VSIPVYFWFPVFGCLGLGFIAMSVPPVADQFMSLFSVGYGGLSFFLSAIYWTQAAIQVPAGLLVDRIGMLRAFLAALALCTIGSLGPLLQPDNLSLAVSFRLLIGVSSGMMFLVLMKILQTLTPANRVARVQGAQGAAFSLGTMLPYFTLPLFGSSGWLAAYFSGPIFCVVIGLCVFRLPLAPLRESRSTAGFAQIWQTMKDIAGSRQIWFLGCCHGLAFGSLTTLGSWLPAILADMRAGSVIDDWAVVTGAILLVGTTGRIFSGDVSRLMPRETLIRRAMLCIGLLYALMALSDAPLYALIPAVALAALCGSTYAAIFTLTIDISSPSYVATAVGFMNMIANGVNILLILLLGNTREFFGGFGPGLWLVVLIAAGLYVWGRRKFL